MCKRPHKQALLLPFILACLFASSAVAHGQSGGMATWEFLNLTNSARVASLGGRNITLRDGDLNLVFHNPSLLDSSMHNHMLINYVNYFAGINYGYTSYSRHHSRFGSFAAGIHYINYGTFPAADPAGTITGDFRAAENSVNISWATKADSLFTAGATLKVISSAFEQYRSAGIAVDAGINYYNPARMLSVSLVMKNLGTQLTAWYPGGEREPLPFELQLGMTKQLAHAPFRFSLLFQHLTDFRLNAPTSGLTVDAAPARGFPAKAEKAAGELIRHLVAGVEFIPVKGFSLQAGYNSLRRHELKIEERVSTVGLSWGFGISVNRFRIGFAQARYHLAGSSAHFSISTNLSSFYSRQNTVAPAGNSQ
jgi:hypothetical protein